MKPSSVWLAVSSNSTSELAFRTIFSPVLSFEKILLPADVLRAEMASSMVALAAIVAVLEVPLM